MTLPTCSKSNQSIFLCESSECKRGDPFVCNSTGCECHEVSHKDCNLILWKKVKNDLGTPEKYKKQFQDIIFHLENMIQDSQRNTQMLKEQIIKCRAFLLKNQENRAAIFRLSEEGKFQKIYKSDVVEYLHYQKISSEQSKLKDIIIKNVKIIKENQLQVHKYFKQIYQSDSNLINSKIISSVQDIGKFFTEKVKELKLLYRASDRNFSTQRFHQLCDNIPNTILVVKTQFDHVFGGFSPCCWGGVGAVQDYSQQSFIFSLTHDQKLDIINPKFAIFNCIKVGPVYGGGNSMMADIEICDRANQVRKSGSNFPVNYNNSSKNYKPGQSSIQYLTGQSKGRYFFIKQWEVFSVSFQSQTQTSLDNFLL